MNIKFRWENLKIKVSLEFLYCRYTFHGLGPLAYSDSETTCETMKPFRHFGKTLSTADRPIARFQLTLQSVTKKNMDIHPCLV
jgi:hypothetical protein